MELGRTTCLLRPLEDLHHAPALGGRERTGLHDGHPVAHATRVALVVGLEPAGAAQNLAVERVLDPVLDDDHDGLVHLVADHNALTDLAPVPGRGLSGVVLGHALTSVGSADSPSSRSR